MTMEDSSLDHYLEITKELSEDVDLLNETEAFKETPELSDSLNEMLQDKADLMYALVTFKNSPEYGQLAQKAMGQISETVDKTVSKPTSIESNTVAPDIKQAAIEQPISTETDSKKKKKEKKENDEGFLKNIFSGKNRDNPESASTVVKIEDTSSAASSIKINLDENPSLDIEEVRRILTEIDKEQTQYNTQLTNYEMEILTSNKVIMNNLTQMIGRMQRDQKLNMEAQFISAGNNAESSSRIILYISVASLLLGLFFMTIILNDINRGNRYKKQLIEARIKAEDLAKAKEEFLANMSHEIRTPLNAIIGFSEQLTQTPLHQTQKNYLKAVQQAGTHLLNTVNDILDISKIEAGKLPLEEKPFRMKEIIEEVVSILRVKAEEKTLKLECSTDLHCEQYTVGDAFRIMQILYNLAGNAIKFTENGYVRIECTGEQKKDIIQFKIDIIDTGIGIESEKLNLIFESFTQADTATTRKFGGTGLGLSISKKLTEFMNGKIQVKSEQNIGSVFTIRLPLPVAEESEIDVIKLETSTDKNLTGLEILIVDDEPYNLMLSEVILKKHGARTTSANSGKEALEKIEAQYFDMILADLQMPEIDGYMLAKKIRAKFIDVPMIALTANVMQGETEIIKKVGFNGILLKPYKEYELLQIIAQNAPVVMGENMQEAVVIMPEKMNGAALYDLAEVKIFTDNENPVLVSVIQSFIENNRINVQQLSNYIASSDLEGVRNTAHKMLPSYTHFKVVDLVTDLKYLETLQADEPGALSKLRLKIETTSEELFAQLEKEIAVLSEDVHV